MEPKTPYSIDDCSTNIKQHYNTVLTSPKRGTYFKHLTTSHSITILLNAPVSALDMSTEQMVYKAC
jgi:hypothetical protein